VVEPFRREALAAAHLPHPNITAVLEFGEEGDRLYRATELLEGWHLELASAQKVAAPVT
jgi:hypothetical protein